MPRTYTVTLDLYTERSQKKPKIEYVEGDAGSELIIKLKSGTSPYDLTDTTEAVVSCVLPNGNTVFSAAAVTNALGGILKYTFVGSELVQLGACMLTPRVISSGNISTTFQTVWYKVVDRVGDDSEIPAQPEYDILLQLIADVEAVDVENLSKFSEDENGYPMYGELSLKGGPGPPGPGGPAGANGKAIELQTTETHIQWRYVNEGNWINLVALETITGAPGIDGADGGDGTDGREMELQASAGYIQWRYVGDTAWTNLVSLVSITGPAGIDGQDGGNGADGANGREVEFQKTAAHIQWRYVGEASWINLVALTDITGPAGVVQAITAGSGVSVDNTDPANPVISATGTSLATILLAVYPVGSIYVSTASTNPAALFGGAWQAWGAGRVPLAIGNNGTTNYPTAEATGGSEEHDHQYGLKAAGFWKATALTENAGLGLKNYRDNTFPASTSLGAITAGFNNSTITGHSDKGSTAYLYETYTSRASSLQPYITCYMWKRTA